MTTTTLHNPQQAINFPVSTIHHRPYQIHSRKGYVQVDGFRNFYLVDLLDGITLNERLNFPPDLFKAINFAR